MLFHKENAFYEAVNYSKQLGFLVANDNVIFFEEILSSLVLLMAFKNANIMVLLLILSILEIVDARLKA